MKPGLVIGKFMPLHTGHVKLIEFALSHCDQLIVLVCANPGEPIPGPLRFLWLQETYKQNPQVKIAYTEEPLPNSSVSSRSISKIWANYLSRRFPQARIIFSSEKYGDYLAEYMDIEHRLFDEKRLESPVSATAIRENPFAYWDYIPPAVRSHYTKKVCIYGTESTGKTTLTEKLASHYQTTHVPEMARVVLGERGVDNLTWEDFPRIAQVHAQEILTRAPLAQKLLFSDTDLITTRIYAYRYFQRELCVPEWVLAANSFDLYLFLDKDVPWIKDPHRNSGHLSEKLHQEFQKALDDQNLPYQIIRGNWDKRFEQAKEIIDKRWFGKF